MSSPLFHPLSSFFSLSSLSLSLLIVCRCISYLSLYPLYVSLRCEVCLTRLSASVHFSCSCLFFPPILIKSILVSSVTHPQLYHQQKSLLIAARNNIITCIMFSVIRSYFPPADCGIEKEEQCIHLPWMEHFGQ